MCGIAGYIGPKEIDSGRLDECLRSMGRRGPDGTGSYRGKTPDGRVVQLLHSRLSIIDLDRRSDQPFKLGSDAIVFNGEIYNYRELKTGLEKLGHGFRTEGDTEVLLKGLMAGGVKSLEACDGMWAFAHYDEAAGRLRLSRDRFGEKPLYMYRDGGGLYFGSEVKFIRAMLGRNLKVNLGHLYRFLVNGYKAVYKVKETFFHGLEELPAGSALEIDAAGERLFRYWIPRIRPEDGMEYPDAVEGVRRRMLESVKIRLRSVVPLAFCMSGGVDSNSLISIAKRVFGYDVQGFTIVNSDSRYEEQELVEASVRELGIRHTNIPLSTEGFMDRMRTLVRYHDAPVFTITYYAHWLLMESIAKHGYKVSLSGTGADELFSGYYDHHLAYMQGVSGEKDRHGAYLAAWEKHIKPGVRNPFLSNPRLFIENRDFRDHIYLNAEGFAECLASPWFEPFKEENYSGELLRNRMLNELFHEAVPLILHEDDLNAMY
jgi:asparagine synthase (glutamine-hydrolysing)